MALDDLRDWDVERLEGSWLLEIAWSLRYDVTAYDAMYLAAAVSRDATLVTADGPLSRLPGSPVPIHNIRV